MNLTNNFQVEPLGKQKMVVYDIEVGDTHTFFANGILVHNSLFLSIEDWILAQGVDKEQWKSMPDEEKVDITLKISKCIEDYVNDRAYSDIQLAQYNSQVTQDHFSIVFKQELVNKTILFVSKKKYAYNVLNEEGISTDKIKVTGLEIIRSETPTIFKKPLENILEMILKRASDKEIMASVKKYKSVIKDAKPEEISTNVGVKNIDKYVDSEHNYIKGTPYHVKGVANYRKLLTILGITDKYKDIEEGLKSHVCYVKPNPHNIEVVTFDEWPKEFYGAGIEPDYTKQIEKFFVRKVGMLLTPMGKEKLLEQGKSAFSAFFG